MSSERLCASGFAYGGEAFGKLPDGRVCFFRGGVPGESAEVDVTVSKRNYARGEWIRAVEPCRERIECRCPLAPGGARRVFCPGCSYQQVDYSVELAWKQRQLSDFIVRGGIADAEVIGAPAAAPRRFNWRNRLKLSRSENGFGFFAEDNRTVVPVKSCPLAVPGIDDAIPAHVEDDVDELYFRWTAADGVIVNEPRRIVTGELPGFGTFKVPAGAFFQTNDAVAAGLLEEVVAILGGLGAERLFELYCGAGIFSLAAAQRLPELRCFGIECDRGAVGNAVRNARDRGVDGRCRFRVGLAEKVTAADCGGAMPDVLLVDPPRRGLERKLAERMLKWRLPYIIYVSCAPDTLARDLRLLSGAYRLIRCRLHDMFPCTGHFETLALLRLK